MLKIVKNYNEKLLSTKVYWENPEERENYKKFWNEYQTAKTDEQTEIAILKRELHDIKEDGPKAKQISQFYKNKLVEFGVMREVKNRCKTMENGRYVKTK